jgi:hypothetical protein
MEACNICARFRNGSLLVLFLFTPTGIVVAKASKTAWLYHVIAAATAIVLRARRNDWRGKCRIAVTIIVALTRAHAIILATAFSTETPQ